MRRCLYLGLSLTSAGLLSGCYSVEPQPLYAPGYQYSSPRYVPPQYAPSRPAYPLPDASPPRYPPPQYDDPRDAEPAPAPYDTRAPDPFTPSMLEPPAQGQPSALDDDAPAPARSSSQLDTPQPPAPARNGARTAAPSNGVPLMGFRPMRGQQGL